MAQNEAQPIFDKIKTKLLPWEKLPNNWAASVIFRKNSRSINRPTGEISPNLVTLLFYFLPSE
jgi:hypothetical protein